MAFTSISPNNEGSGFSTEPANNPVDISVEIIEALSNATINVRTTDSIPRFIFLGDAVVESNANDLLHLFKSAASLQASAVSNANDLSLVVQRDVILGPVGMTASLRIYGSGLGITPDIIAVSGNANDLSVSFVPSSTFDLNQQDEETFNDITFNLTRMKPEEV